LKVCENTIQPIKRTLGKKQTTKTFRAMSATPLFQPLSPPVKSTTPFGGYPPRYKKTLPKGPKENDSSPARTTPEHDRTPTRTTKMQNILFIF
jgi:hypothetical protein